MKRTNAFTLIELLVVVAIIGIIMAILLPALSKAKEYGRKVSCGSNLKQIAIALQNYAMDHNGIYPLAAMAPSWDLTYDDPNDLYTRMGWMRRLFPYVGQQSKVYRCPSFPRDPDSFNYFLGTRAGYARKRMEGFDVDHSRVSVRRDWIEYPTAYVLGGDCNNSGFDRLDCDRDDYTQPCLALGDTYKNDSTFWEPWHDKGMNILFADTHVRWFDRELPNLMTYSYNDYKNWADALPIPGNI